MSHSKGSGDGVMSSDVLCAPKIWEAYQESFENLSVRASDQLGGAHEASVCACRESSPSHKHGRLV